MKHICDESGYTFIDNSIIDESGLNNSKLHLSPNVSALLARRFIKFISPDKQANNQSQGNPFTENFETKIEVVDNWSINIDNDLLNGVIFIDLEKAFDTIDYAILLRKLQIYSVDQNGIKFFESYLSNRSQRCCVN